MQTREIEITNPDNSLTVVHIYESGTNSNDAVVIILPAMGMRAAYYSPLAESLAHAGYTAVTADLRGKGTSSVRPSRNVNFGYKEMIDWDIDQIVHNLRNEFPSGKIVLLGHSLGGQLGCLYASKKPVNVDALILVACCSVYYKGWEGLAKYRILMGTQFIGALSTAVGYFPGKQVGFGGTNAKGVMQDWSRQSRTGKYRLNNDEFDYETALGEVDIPILTISFEGDDLAPFTAVQHLMSKFQKAEHIRNIHLEKSDPMNDGFNHFNWPKKPDKIVELCSGWFKAATPGE